MRLPLRTSVGFCLAVMVSCPALAQDVKSPQEIYGAQPNNLADIPAGWAQTNRVELQVRFNLKYPPGSPEAQAFLEEYGRFERSLPFHGHVTISRIVAPTTYKYVGRLSFATWREYQIYEKSDAFRQWYVSVWKPAVTTADEMFTVEDIKANGP